MDYEKKIEIPFGAKDSELKGWEYTIPAGMEAEIKDGKVIVREKDSKDERMVRIIEDVICTNEGEIIAQKYGLKLTDLADWLEKQKDEPQRQYNLGVQAGREEALYEIEKQKEQKRDKGDFTIYHPLKNGKGEYECIPYSFYGSLTSFSEDKDLIDFLRTCFYKEEECKGWIEKQKDQKPAEWSDNFEENIRELLHDKLTWHSEDGSMSSAVLIDDKTLKDIISGIWFYVGKEALKYPNKELSQPDWSEEEQQIIEDAACALISFSNTVETKEEEEELCELASKLQDLKPQPHWKPSKEQMEALWDAYKGGKEQEPLREVIEQLKKLM